MNKACKLNQPKSRARKPLTEAVALLRQARLSLQGIPTGQRVWREVFSDDDRERLGGRFVPAWRRHRGLVGMAATAWNCSADEAIVRICEELSAWSPSQLRWIREALQLSPKRATGMSWNSKPIWKKDASKLMFAGKVVRTIRSTTVASRIVLILDCFETDCWTERIDSPFPPSHKQELREAVQSLNRRLKGIRFESDGTGTGIRWRIL